MMTHAALVFTLGGMAAVLMWLVAFGLCMLYALRSAETTTHLTTAEMLTRIGLLIGAAGWGGYVALTWPQLPGRVALLPPVALAALGARTILTRRRSMSSVTPYVYGCAVTAYGAALVAFWTGNVAGMGVTSPALLLVALREIAAAIAAGALLTYGIALLMRHYPARTLDTSQVEHLSDGTVRAALMAVTIALAAAAWHSWSAWGEVARADVTTLFIAWASLMAVSLWQMTTGMTMTRMVNGLALLALALLLVMLALIP